MIDLGENEVWLEFEYEGRTEKIEASDALAIVKEVEQQHAESTRKCSSCGAVDGFHAADPGKELSCKSCGKSEVMVYNGAFLIAIGNALKEQFGYKAVSGRAAAMFRNAVMQALEDAKKKRETLPESPTGSESTPADGAT